jgi:hypothetical protein
MSSVIIKGNPGTINQIYYLLNKGINNTITFLTSKNLEKYIEVVEWDQGYLVVISKNKGKEQEEDYIDLVPILENLLIDPVSFLDPIKEVKIRYA